MWYIQVSSFRNLPLGKVTRVTFVARYSVNDPRSANQPKFECPQTGAFITFSLIVRADLSWPGKQNMADFAKKNIQKLRDAGLFDDNDLLSLDARLWDSTFVRCVVEVDDLAYAQEIFDKATSHPDPFVDIYLYDGDKLIDKLD